MAIYHLTASFGNRKSGHSALAKARYILREGCYKERDNELVYAASRHMPAWAEHDELRYWSAADAFERANGKLFYQIEFALPIELNRERQIELAHTFAEHLSREPRDVKGALPYTLAIHQGKGQNPHVHLMRSERANDGIERDAMQWFKRADMRYPERGGAAKTRSFQPKEWLLRTREAWAKEANRALEREHHKERIDHRSLREQGIEREPGYHIGPYATKLEREHGVRSRKWDIHERTENQQRQALEHELDATEKELVRWAGYVKGFEREKAAELHNALDRLSQRDAVKEHPELERVYPLLAAYAQHARESGLDRTEQAKLLDRVKEQAVQKLAVGERLLEPEELPFNRERRERQRGQERDRDGLERAP